MSIWTDAHGIWTPDTWLVVFAGATFVTAIVAAVVGLRQLAQSVSISRNQSRPYVTADLGVRDMIILIQLSNVGSRPARNVTVRFTPELNSTVPDMLDTLRRAFDPSDPISILPVGRVVEWELDSGLQAVGSDKVPQVYELVIEYEDVDPRRVWAWKRWRPGRRDERYIDRGNRLSLKLYNETRLPPPGMPELVSAVRKIGR